MQSYNVRERHFVYVTKKRKTYGCDYYSGKFSSINIYRILLFTRHNNSSLQSRGYNGFFLSLFAIVKRKKGWRKGIQQLDWILGGCSEALVQHAVEPTCVMVNRRLNKNRIGTSTVYSFDYSLSGPAEERTKGNLKQTKIIWKGEGKNRY